MTTAAPQLHRGFGVSTWAALTLGALVAVALGVYGRLHEPTGKSMASFGFASMIEMKVWLAVAAGLLAVLQLVTALWMYGKLGIRAPKQLGLAHRVTGATALLVSLPVAYHCLWSLGFQTYDGRVLMHSLLGCLIYGAAITKVLSLHISSTAGWLLPVAGGLLFTALVGTVLTSAGWYLSEFGLPSTSGG